MNKLKRIYMTFMLIILMGVCGCMNTYSPKKIVEEFNQKYDDEFTVVATDTGTWREDHADMVLKSQKLNSNIVVWIYEDGKVIDNYVAVKYKNEVEQKVKPLIEKVYGKCVIKNLPINEGSSDFYPKMTLSEYMSNVSSMIYIGVATNRNKSTYKEDTKKVVDLFKENNIIADLDICHYTDVKDVKINEESGKLFKPMPPIENRIKVYVQSDYSIDYILATE